MTCSSDPEDNAVITAQLLLAEWDLQMPMSTMSSKAERALELMFGAEVHKEFKILLALPARDCQVIKQSPKTENKISMLANKFHKCTDSVRFGAKFRGSHIQPMDSQIDMLKKYNCYVNTYMKQKSHPSFSWFSGSEIE